METRYTNRFGNPISEQQLSLINEYRKVFEVNGVSKYIEHYENNLMTYIEYYKADNELIDVISNQLKENVQSFVIIENENINGYRVENQHSFINSTLYVNSQRLLYDNQNRLTCYQTCFDDQTPDLSSTEKYYYDAQPNKKIVFCYDDDGIVVGCHAEGYPPFDREYNDMPIEYFNQHYPTFFNDHPYYLNANFIP